MSRADLAAIRERHAMLPRRGGSPDIAALLIEVDRLRAIITGQIDAARREWLDEGDTNALARSEYWRTLFNPTEGDRDE